MDGIHDCGGMQGFGPINRETDEPVFHHEWEKRVFALSIATSFVTVFGDDQFRKQIERIPPSEYINNSYYALWLEALISQLKDMKVIDDNELERGASITPLPKCFDISKQAQAVGLEEVVKGGASQAMPDSDEYPQRFKTGDKIRTRPTMSYGHNRLPRYARNKTGTIISENGNFVFADSNAEQAGLNPQMLYTVEFKSEELWANNAEPGGTVCLDLWDAYLETL